MVLKRTNSDEPAFRSLIKELDKDLRERYGSMQDSYDGFNKIDYIDTVVIAMVEEIPAGCGCIKKIGDNTVEVKRMFVAANNRGQGIGFAILSELEKWAAELGYSEVVLETARRQPEAIGLYQKKGYQVIPNYGPYVDMAESVCMKKSLPVTKAEKIASQH
jgi:putative acetyltransferase